MFIGLGLWDERDITLRGYEEARNAQVLFAEFYTSRLVGTTKEKLEGLLGRPITVLSREQVEDGRLILSACRSAISAFLVPGDPMTATTHVELRTRAEAQGIHTRVVHGPSIVSAAPGTLGLQIYKFGRTTTIPFTTPSFRPRSPLEVLEANLRDGLHTLLLLDLRDGEVLSANDALAYLLDLAREGGSATVGPHTLACVLSQVGSPGPTVNVGSIGDLLGQPLGEPLQCVVIPGKLHFQEEAALARLRR